MQWKKFAYWVLLVYLGIGLFLFPALGVVALVCMLAPVVLALTSGRRWCGLYCPRGSFWDQIIGKISRGRPIPGWAKATWFRVFMVVFIFSMFGWQMAAAWPDPAQIGLVFLRIIFITTLIGIVLGIIYSPRTWCSFCPMGTMASWVAAWRRKKPLAVQSSCVACGLCAKACPMQLAPQKEPLFQHPDCLKCGECVAACPKKAIGFAEN